MRFRAVAFVLTLTAVSHAASPAAEALFQEGRRLLEAGQTDEACIKFAESYAQDASSGTLLNLALCHEKQGRVATAWAEYRAAARLARSQGRADRADTAEQRAALLEGSLPSLIVRAARPAPGLTITIDEQALGEGVLGVPVPVDPGPRRITARAAGRKPWSTTLTVEEASQNVLEIPELEAAPEVAPPAQPARAHSQPQPPPSALPPREIDANDSTTLGWWVLGGGGVALAGGAVFGLISLESYRDAHEACPTRRGCSAGSVADRDRAEREAWISNVAVGVGLVGVGVGSFLLLSAGGNDRGGVSFRARPLDRGAWLGVSDEF